MGGIAPYGYKTVPKADNDSSTLAINDDETKNVRLIFKLYSENNGYAKIARILNNDLHITTRIGNLWTYTSLAQMLLNPVYNGKIRYGKHVDWDSKRRKGKVDDKDVIIVDGKHEAIIDDSLWNKVQEIHSTKSGKKNFAAENQSNFSLV